MSTLNVRKDGRRPRILTAKDQEREDSREFREYIKAEFSPMHTIFFPDGNIHIVGGRKTR